MPEIGGHIYFLKPVGQPGPIKIGFTRFNPIWRLQGCQTGSPLELELIAHREGTSRDEKRLHEKFQDQRLRGEWFKPSSALLRFIENEEKLPDHDEGRVFNTSEFDYIPEVPQHRPTPPPSVRQTLTSRLEERYTIIEELLRATSTVDQIAFALNCKPKTVLRDIDRMAKLGFAQGSEFAVEKEFAEDLAA